MENDEKELEINLDIEEEVETPKEEKKEEKPQQSPEDRLARLKRETAQLEKKLGKTTEEKPAEKKSDELDYGAKAYLRAEGIKRGEEENLVRQVMAQTGKSLEDVLDSKYFQAELKELRESVATANAVPNGSKRSSQSARDSVEYWIAKGELPPREERELRQKVVNAKIKSESQTNIFSQNPIVR